MNKIRGEVLLQSKQRDYVLIPSFASMARIEGELGINLFEIAKIISENKLTINHMISIIKHSLYFNEHEIAKNEEITNIIEESGYKKAHMAVIELFNNFFLEE